LGDAVPRARAGPKTKAGDERRQDHDLFDQMSRKCKADATLSRLGRMGLDLDHRFEAARADVTANPLAVLQDGRPLDIRPELALRLSLGEAHIVAAHRPLATYFTFRHNFTLPQLKATLGPPASLAI